MAVKNVSNNKNISQKTGNTRLIFCAVFLILITVKITSAAGLELENLDFVVTDSEELKFYPSKGRGSG